VGLGAFEQGGVLLDGGKGDDDEPPPIVSRLPFPAPWRVLLIQDRRRDGVHGSDEAAAFQNLTGFSDMRAGQLCRLVLMQALPALAERDLGRFGAAVTEIQETIGDHFAPAQGGRYSSPAVADALAWLGREGVAGMGQSSWGPTGFALIGSEQEARNLQDEARRRWPKETGLSFQVHLGRNGPAKIETGVMAGAELQS
jgi:beta-RFAP synthase